MTKILKGRNVFLDTCLFVTDLFHLKNPAFEEFTRLCVAGELVLLTTDITRNEIRIRIALEAKETHAAAVRIERAIRSLPHIKLEDATHFLNQLGKDAFSIAWQKAVDDFFVKCKAKHVKLPTAAADVVMTNYFERRPPFSGKKKTEFPDAFVLTAIDTVRTSQDEFIYVVSEDEDFKNACAERPHFKHFSSLAGLLNQINKNKFLVSRVFDTLDKQPGKVDSELNAVIRGLEPELQGFHGSVELNEVTFDTILDRLVVSCEESLAAVDFVCGVVVDAVAILGGAWDTPEQTIHVHQQQTISITLEFVFDPKDSSVFEVKAAWVPRLMISPY